MLGRSRGPTKSPVGVMKSPLWTTLPAPSVYVPIVSTRYGCASETGIVFGRTDWPYSFRNVTASRPSASLSPRFVKIWITPFAASEPYSDDAAAPFTSSTRSDRKSTRLNSSHGYISYAVFCLKKKKINNYAPYRAHTPSLTVRPPRILVHRI